jgi:hypothetical protein
MGFEPRENADYCNRRCDKDESLGGHGVAKDSRSKEICAEPATERGQVHTEDDAEFPAEKVIEFGAEPATKRATAARTDPQSARLMIWPR